jgi:hypothetical protein
MRRAGWADVTGRNARHEFRVTVIPTVHIIKAATFCARAGTASPLTCAAASTIAPSKLPTSRNSWPPCRGWAVSAGVATPPASCRSRPRRPGGGSTARWSTPAADSSDHRPGYLRDNQLDGSRPAPPTESEKGMLLGGKSIVVTGGNTGVGEAIVLAAAAEGANVVVDYVMHPDYRAGVIAAAGRSAARSAWGLTPRARRTCTGSSGPPWRTSTSTTSTTPRTLTSASPGSRRTWPTPRLELLHYHVGSGRSGHGWWCDIICCRPAGGRRRRCGLRRCRPTRAAPGRSPSRASRGPRGARRTGRAARRRAGHR